MIRYFMLFLLCTNLSAAIAPNFRWQKTEITWSSEEQYRDKVSFGCNIWQTALSNVIKFREVTLLEKPDVIILTDRTLDYLNIAAYVKRNLSLDNSTITSAMIYVVKPEAELDNILVHEIGHVLGLPHSDNQESIMYFSPFFNTLHKLDAEAICAIYGVSPIEPDFGVTITQVKNKKWLLKIKYNSIQPIWQSVKVIRHNGYSRRYFEEFGNEVICKVYRYPFQISLIYRGYLQTFVIEKPQRRK